MMLSIAFRRQCVLCCRNLPAAKNVHMVSQGRNLKLMRDCLPFSSSFEQTIYRQQRILKCKWVGQTCNAQNCSTHVVSGENDEHTTVSVTDAIKTDDNKSKAPGPVSRTLWLGIPNSDVIIETVQELSEDILDVELYYRVDGHSYAYLVFGSEEVAAMNYIKLTAIGLDIKYLDAVRRTVWIDFESRPATEDSIKEKMPDCVDIKLTTLGNGNSYAYVEFPSVKAARTNKRKFKNSSIDRRTESTISQVDHSRSLWLGYFDATTTEEALQNLSMDTVKVLLRHTDDSRGHAYLEYESADLAEKNYHQLQHKEVKVQYAHIRQTEVCVEGEKDCTLFMPIGMKAITRESLSELSNDITEAHVVDNGRRFRYAYLRFETRKDAERNCNLLREQSDASSDTPSEKKEQSISSEKKEQSISSEKKDQSIPSKKKDQSKENFDNSVKRREEERLRSKLYLGNLDNDVTKEYIESLISGDIEFIKLIRRRDCYVAFVEFASEEEAEKNKQLLHEMGVDVNYSDQRGKGIRKRTVCLMEPTLTQEEIKQLSDEIVNVHMVTKGRQTYANIVFRTCEARDKHVWKFRNQNLNVHKWEYLQNLLT